MAGPSKEATARIKVNKLLEESGWRFFDDGGKPANIQLEPSVKIKSGDLDDLGDDFESTSKGAIDFLLLDPIGKPIAVLEAKAESKDPLIGKEQARKYAKSVNCRFVLLSNGNLHYYWDLQHGNPEVITAFPTPESLTEYKKVDRNPAAIVDQVVERDWIVLTQRSTYASEAGYVNEAEREAYKRAHNLRFLRDYQLRAVHSIQKAVAEGKSRFLFEMATGTGKTLVAAAVAKLFLRSGNCKRVLFLVDRLELEDQANKAFTQFLGRDFTPAIYKEKRESWKHADIVVTTVQSLMVDNKYRTNFSPTDFDLVISDEAHRSIGGNARAVFEYFVGYKLGLTATPKNYLKNFDKENPTSRDPREAEMRVLRDTYITFGCQPGEPTFSYSLLDGVRDGVLINPMVIDARTDITTELLSDKGWVLPPGETGEGEQATGTFTQRDFEKGFISEETNNVLCDTFLKNALRDPISGEIGKSIVFAVSQRHASKLVQIMNVMADRMFSGKYQSDFAVQVTSQIPDAQQFTINFANNNLLGSGNFNPHYRTSKARVCVTVGMMTTGYDCTDILNIGLFGPIFSPTDFIQIKGRGTRTHDFRNELIDDDLRDNVLHPEKKTFKLFDFFANCDYFEDKFNYDEVLKLPRPGEYKPPIIPPPIVVIDNYTYGGADSLRTIEEEQIGFEGMKIDRKFFEKFSETVQADKVIREAVDAGQWDRVIAHVNEHIMNKPEEYYTLERLRKAASVDRRLSMREILEKIFGLIPEFKSREQLLEEEFAKFIALNQPNEMEQVQPIRAFFKAYLTDANVQNVVRTKEFARLATNPVFSIDDLKAVPRRYRKLVPEYVLDYVSLNKFAA